MNTINYLKLITSPIIIDFIFEFELNREIGNQKKKVWLCLICVKTTIEYVNEKKKRKTNVFNI